MSLDPTAARASCTRSRARSGPRGEGQLGLRELLGGVVSTGVEMSDRQSPWTKPEREAPAGSSLTTGSRRRRP
ncbi:hypothetical protein [Pseudonocardia xishanensis]|uniref:hypothetical protein n=1 Tax=Pseudonocardia xishanensis TaxID=630995 RepID=UPI0031F16B04